MTTTVVHLLRHGEVANPRHVLYGRLPGFHLSEEGQLQAKAAARHLAGHDVTALFSSPLERAQETAAALSEQDGLPVTLDDRLIEAGNHFEGLTFGVGDGSLLRPQHWSQLRNPFRPSWGEPYRDIADRMLAAMATAAVSARGHEAVCVSHQLPIEVVRRWVECRRLWHHPSRRRVALASVTSFTYTDDQVTGLGYWEPSAAGAPGPAGA
ncbi:MAG: histidine phosphatase family protein [Actinobacteria bacterium]|nr:histidine phosphatase family protein [Actinomycetota bacterium]